MIFTTSVLNQSTTSLREERSDLGGPEELDGVRLTLAGRDQTASVSGLSEPDPAAPR